MKKSDGKTEMSTEDVQTPQLLFLTEIFFTGNAVWKEIHQRINEIRIFFNEHATESD
jgi:hypothetical protein